MRYTGFVLTAGLLAAVLCGCNEPASTTSTDTSSTTASTPSSTGGGESASTATGGGESSAGGSLEIKYNEKDLEALEKRLAATPDDAELKKETAEAAYHVGYTFEHNPELSFKIKYRTALKHFRRALALNPDHAGAAAEKKQIEDIYVQMGRPIPQ